MIKKIEAVIRPEKLSATIKALSEIGVIGLSAQDVKGRGRDAGLQLQWRGDTYNVELLPKTMVTIIISEENVEKTVETIRKTAGTGSQGDGVIFVSPVEDIVRISTGETGRESISYQGDMDSRKRA